MVVLGFVFSSSAFGLIFSCCAPEDICMNYFDLKGVWVILCPVALCVCVRTQCNSKPKIFNENTIISIFGYQHSHSIAELTKENITYDCTLFFFKKL